MTLNLFKKIINELTQIHYQGEIYLHHYGEPLLDNRLDSFVTYVHKKLPKAIIVIYSNGDLLTPERALDLFSRGVGRFWITVHPPPSESNKKFLEWLDKEKIRHTWYLNKIYMEGLIDLFNRGGIINQKTHKDASFLNPKVCALTGPVIDWEGKAILCCQDYLARVVLGDVNKESLVSIWKKPAYRRARHQLRLGIPPYSICKSCMKKSGTKFNLRDFLKGWGVDWGKLLSSI